MKNDSDFKTNLLLGLFVAALIAGNLIGTKITKFWIIEVSVGIFAYPLTFLITDAVQEVYGKEKANQFVWVGFICLLFILMVTAFAVWLPFAPRSFVKENYTQVFGSTLRIFVASIIAFMASQFHDVWAFNFWKQQTKGRFLWLRNNASTIVSQFIDTVMFMFIAFYGLTPKHNAAYMFTLIIPYYLLKIVIALADTAPVYLIVWWLRGSGKDTGKR
ncbi:queuosine precursor transporter [Candidatus Woesearchaeota archaeon]|nr:queuosine precursor transporter [Candidatus Woesearchaeota archaeon]